MRWYEALMLSPVAVSTDKLGHDITELQGSGTCLVRKAPVKPYEDDVEGNRMRRLQRAFLTPTAAECFAEVKAVKVRGRTYKLDNVASLENGHTMLTVTDYKPEVADASFDHCQGL